MGLRQRSVMAVGSALAVALAACGAFQSGTSSRAAGGPVPTCRAAQLEGSLALAGGAGGNYSYRGTLRNVSKQGCALYGYVRLVPLSSSGRPEVITDPVGQRRGLDSQPLLPGEYTYLLFHPPHPVKVTLSPAGSAFFNLTYVNLPAGKQTTCPNIGRVALTPPGDRQRLIVRVVSGSAGVGALLSVCEDPSVEAVEGHPYAG